MDVEGGEEVRADFTEADEYMYNAIVKRVNVTAPGKAALAVQRLLDDNLTSVRL